MNKIVKLEIGVFLISAILFGLAGCTEGNAVSPGQVQADSPYPVDNAGNIPIDQQLSWVEADGATSYDVYFAVTTSGWTPVTNTTLTTYNPLTLTSGATYYWRVDSKNGALITAGNIWSFTTESQTSGLTFMGNNRQGYKEYQHNLTKMIFVELPAGTFQMGSEHANDDDELPLHSVALSSFLISKYEVTQGVWQAVMRNNPSRFKQGDDYPVECVTWDDCQSFCNNTDLRFPTEAEWEYACRAGTITDFYWGANIDENYLWYNDNSKTATHPVGEKLPNSFGLYDMSGNVSEWCQDWYDRRYYGESPLDNPQGSAIGTERILRGGCWYFEPDICRSARRLRREPAYVNTTCGFRCAADLK